MHRVIQAVKGSMLGLRKEPQATAALDVAAKLTCVWQFAHRPEAWRLPEALAEASETESNGLRPGRVVSVIAILEIVLIAIMAGSYC
jgi:hypothetical protein